MNLQEKKKIKDKIKQMIDEKFEFADVKYILIKKQEGKYDYIVGVSAFEGEYIFMPYHEKPIIDEYRIQFKKKYRELFDECSEGYVLLMLEKGYTVFSMDIHFHYQMWDFIDYYNNEVFEVAKGLNVYLNYCKNNSITKELIENETFEMVNDIISVYLEEIIDGYYVGLADSVGDKKTVLGYRWDVNPLDYEARIIYKVMTIDLNTSQIISEDYHDKIDNAFNDYFNRYITDTLRYYNSLDSKNQVIVDELKKKLEGKDDGNG